MIQFYKNRERLSSNRDTQEPVLEEIPIRSQETEDDSGPKKLQGGLARLKQIASK
jgi:hypothetical protein